MLRSWVNKGFTALKLALSETLVNRQDPPSILVHNQILSDDPIKTVDEKLLAEKVAALRGTLDINSETNCTRAWRCCNARSGLLVQALGPDDLLFAISFSGTRREINLAAQEALRAGAQVMAVTNFAPNELQHYTDLTLYTISQQQT